MSKRQKISMVAMVALVVGTAWAQDSSPQPAPETGQDNSQQQTSTPPNPAYGQTNAVPISENPPISGLDQPALGPHAAPLSYLQPGATISESADSNVEDTLGGGS